MQPLMTPPPDTYYEMMADRLPGHGQPVDQLRSRGILLDGSTADGQPRLLLQIFSECLIGPVFFEFIERRQDEGFGRCRSTARRGETERRDDERGAGASADRQRCGARGRAHRLPPAATSVGSSAA